jgi:hypothetical protein
MTNLDTVTIGNNVGLGGWHHPAGVTIADNSVSVLERCHQGHFPQRYCLRGNPLPNPFADAPTK